MTLPVPPRGADYRGMSDPLARLREDLAKAEIDRPFDDDPAAYLGQRDCAGIAAAYRVCRKAGALLDIAEAAQAIKDSHTAHGAIDSVPLGILFKRLAALSDTQAESEADPSIGSTGQQGL